MYNHKLDHMLGELYFVGFAQCICLVQYLSVISMYHVSQY